MSDNTLIGAGVISAYVTHNPIPASELPDLIRAVVAALDNLDRPRIVEEPALKLVPAVPIKKSVHHDFLFSLEDGKKYQTLRRHLSALGMTPEEYRAKWGLAGDYPMTSAAYSAKRSAMSRDLGLGRRKALQPVQTPAATKKPRSQPTDLVETSTPAIESDSVQDGSQAAQEAA